MTIMRTPKHLVRHGQVMVALCAALLLSSCATRIAPEVAGASSEAARLYSEAREALYEADSRFEYPAAIELLERAVAADPANARARLDLIYAYTKQGRYEDAEPHALAASGMANRLTDAQRLWLAALRERLADRPQREIDAWRAVTAAEPANRWAWYELAVSLSALERYDEAADAAAQALALQPDPGEWDASWLHYMHSKALFRSGQYDAAVNAAENGRSLPDTWRATYYRLALARAKAGQADELDAFIDEYRRITAEEGRTSPAYLEANIALMHFELGNYDRAAELARRALAMEDTAYPGWVLGYSLIEAGRPTEALRELEAARARHPDDVYLSAARGWALYRLDRLEEARTALLEARALSKRTNYRVEHDLAAVERALADPDAPRAAPIPWLG